MEMAIEDKPRRLRLLSKGIDLKANRQSVEREGGDFGAGVIYGYSVITEGEALGHSMWIDKEFLNQVATAGNEKPAGLKSRFTHPGLSGDGLGKAIGKSKNFRVKGNQVFADLHFFESAHELPELGDAAGYLMGMAEEAPEDFGTSIVFDPDVKAEREFIAANGGKVVEDDEGTHYGKFQSPDKKNKKNFRHARLASLNASDVVDEPAANPHGMFSAGFLPGSELAARAEAVLSFAFGLTDEAPDELAAGPHPERARVFVQGFLERHGLEFKKKDNTEHPALLGRLAALERSVECLKARFELKEAGR